LPIFYPIVIHTQTLDKVSSKKDNGVIWKLREHSGILQCSPAPDNKQRDKKTKAPQKSNQSGILKGDFVLGPSIFHFNQPKIIVKLV